MARLLLPPLRGAHRHRRPGSPKRKVPAVLRRHPWAEVSPLGLVDRDVVDAGLSSAHQTGLVELPQFVAVTAPPPAGGVAALVLEPDGDVVVVETPQALAQRIVEFALPFPGQERHDRRPADDVLAPVPPL